MEVFLIIYHSLKHNTITTKGGIIMVDSMEKIVALCKSRGFVYPGSEETEDWLYPSLFRPDDF